MQRLQLQPGDGPLLSRLLSLTQQAGHFASSTGAYPVERGLKYVYELKLQCLCMTKSLFNSVLSADNLKILCADLLLLTGNQKLADQVKAKPVFQVQ